MRATSSGNVELSMVLPLGVIANQLLKVEAELRFLHTRTSAGAGERLGSAGTAQVAAQLEKIQEALEAIRALLADIETDLQPTVAGAKLVKMRTDRDD